MHARVAIQPPARASARAPWHPVPTCAAAGGARTRADAIALSGAKGQVGAVGAHAREVGHAAGHAASRCVGPGRGAAARCGCGAVGWGREAARLQPALGAEGCGVFPPPGVTVQQVGRYQHGGACRKGNENGRTGNASQQQQEEGAHSRRWRAGKPRQGGPPAQAPRASHPAAAPSRQRRRRAWRSARPCRRAAAGAAPRARKPLRRAAARRRQGTGRRHRRPPPPPRPPPGPEPADV